MRTKKKKLIQAQGGSCIAMQTKAECESMRLCGMDEEDVLMMAYVSQWREEGYHLQMDKSLRERVSKVSYESMILMNI